MQSAYFLSMSSIVSSTMYPLYSLICKYHVRLVYLQCMVAISHVIVIYRLTNQSSTPEGWTRYAHLLSQQLAARLFA